jgi:Ca2+/Na+ antiporter
MKITHTIIVMFIGSFIIQYFFMPAIMVNKFMYVTNSIGKAYMSIIMALYMILIEIMMHDHQYSVLSLKWYISLFILIAIFTYLYKKQIAIDDKQYLEGMIEHHSMAILTSEEILNKTDSYDVAKLAKNILQTQSDEIRIMKNLLNKEKLIK